MNIEGFDNKMKYWEAFWQGEVLDRPLICVTSPKNNVVYHEHNQTDALSAQACLSEEYDDFLDSFRKNLRSTYYGGEAIPFANITLGPDQYAGFLGSKIEVSNQTGTTWAKSTVDSWSGYEVRLDDSKNSYFDKLNKFLQYCASVSNDEYITGMIDLHGNMDALSALRGPQNLCLDLIDCPDEVHRVLNDVRKTYPAVFESAYSSAGLANTGSCGWTPVYAPTGKFAVVQCDFSCLISPDQAREFVIPAIEEEAAYLDKNVYHFDGKDALGHLDDILAIEEIDVLQWVPGAGQPRSIEWMDLLKKIQSAGKGLWVDDWTSDEIAENFKELNPSKLVFSLNVSTEDEARRLIERVARNM